MKNSVLSLVMAFCLSIGIANAQNISDDAIRHFDRGQAAVEMAKSPANYEGAINNLNTYLRLVPSSSDANQIQEKIYKLEYKMERMRGFCGNINKPF